MEPLGGLSLLSEENSIGLERGGSAFTPTEKAHTQSPAARRLRAVQGDVSSRESVPAAAFCLLWGTW